MSPVTYSQGQIPYLLHRSEGQRRRGMTVPRNPLHVVTEGTCEFRRLV